jgi:hypothetical protein
MCLLLGQGFRVSNFTALAFPANSETYIESSFQFDSAVIGLERQVPTQNKAPRRQASFGVLPTGIEVVLPDVAGERTLAEVRCDSLIAASHQNDRAPPA